MQLKAYEGLHQYIYFTGFVLDQNGQGVSGVKIYAIYDNQEIFKEPLQTYAAGWFETRIPLTEEYIGKEIKLYAQKSGFKIADNADKPLLLKETYNFVTLNLEPVEGLSPKISGERDPLAYVFGYINNPIDNLPIPGARVSLNVDGNEISVDRSRDSGYFTLHFDAKKHLNREATIIVVHQTFNKEETEYVILKRQNDLVKIDLFPQGYLFITSFPAILSPVKYPHAERIMIYGKRDENYSNVFAKWGQNSRQARVVPSNTNLWAINLPVLDKSNINKLSFSFTKNLHEVDAPKKNEIIEAFFNKHTDCFDSTDDKISVANLRKNLNYIFGNIFREELFVTGSDFQKDLDRIVVSSKLRNIFKKNKIIVSSEVNISKEVPDSIWKIYDEENEKRYLAIKKGDGKIYFYLEADIQLRDTSKNRVILEKIRDGFNRFDSRYHDKKVCQLEIIEELKKLELETEARRQKDIAPKRFAIGLGENFHIPLYKSGDVSDSINFAGGVDLYVSWFPWKTTPGLFPKPSFKKNNFSLDAGVGKALTKLEIGPKKRKVNKWANVIRFGFGYRIPYRYNFFQFQFGLSTLFIDNYDDRPWESWNVYFGLGIPFSLALDSY